MINPNRWKVIKMFQTTKQWGYLGMGQNLVPLVNIKIAGKWMLIPLKMVLIGIDSYPFQSSWFPILKTHHFPLHSD